MKKIVHIVFLLIVSLCGNASAQEEAVNPVKVSVAESEISRLLYQQIMNFRVDETVHWLELGRGIVQKDGITRNLYLFKDLIYLIIENNSGQPDIRNDQLPENIKKQLLGLKDQIYLAVDLLSEQSQSSLQKETKLALDLFYKTLVTKPSRILPVGYSNMREPSRALSSNIVKMIYHYHEPTVIHYPLNDLYYVELRQMIARNTLDFLAFAIGRIELNRAEIEQVIRDLGNEQGKFKEELFAKLKLKLDFEHRFINVKKMVINEIRITLNSIIHIQELPINLFKTDGDYRGKGHHDVGERYLRDLTVQPMESSRLSRLQNVMRSLEVR